MKILSVNVGLPREVNFKGETVKTGIFKEPVKGRVKLRTLNLDGDRQADLTVHGGIDKAIYAYPSEHYDYWRRELPEMAFSWGMFGENFTTVGLVEDYVNIGDKFQIGTSRLIATQPRMPCYKLGIKFGRTDIIRKFLKSRRPGIYFKVLREGEVGEGDEIKLFSRNTKNVTISDIVRLYVEDKNDVETMKRAISVESLPKGWKHHFQEQIKQQELAK
ncbi:MAG TPA: MOSC domain-containing protein [Nitrososphaeraceae archaeon]